VPSEHGGWGLTLEPVLLGLLVSWSWAGLLLGVVAFLAFLVRTPLKTAAADRRRGRWLPRSRVAARLAAVEVVVAVALAVVCVSTAGWRWLVPVAIAAPLVAVELWFDVRLRSRRLVPEICGAVGIAAVSAAIVVAGGGGAALAAGVWLVLAGRSIGSVPFVRFQIDRLHRRAARVATTDVAQVLAVGSGVAATLVEGRVVAGLVALVVLGAVHAVWARRAPAPAKVLGIAETVFGLALVAATAAGVHL